MELTGQFRPLGKTMADKAKQILKTAERLFATGRYHEVTLDEICKEAGVGKGTVYRYFKDKEDLYWQVILSGLDELVASVEHVGEQQPDAGQGLRLLVQCIADFFKERGALFGLMWSQQLRGSGRKKHFWKQWGKKDERMVAVAAGFIVRGTEEGHYASRFSPAAAARLLLGMVRTGLRNWKEMPAGKDWPLAVVDLFESGLLVRKDRK